MKRSASTIQPPPHEAHGHQSLSAYIQARLRRFLAFAEGCGAVHRRSPGRSGLPDGGGARAAREHLELDGRALQPGAGVRGIPRAAAVRARGVSPRQRRRDGHDAERGTALQPRPERVRDGDRLGLRQRRGDGAQGLALRRRGRRRRDRERREGADLRHRPDGVLRVLPASPADAAGPARRDRRKPVAGGAQPPQPHRRHDARHRPVRRAPAPAGRACDEARPPPQGAARSRSPTRHSQRSPSSPRCGCTTRRTRRPTCARTRRC